MTDAKLEILMTAKDVTGKVFSEVNGRVKSLTSTVFSLNGAITTLLGGYAFKELASGAVEVASSFEQMEVKLDKLTNGRGRQTLAELNKWALDMPVNTQEAVKSFVTMQAFGLDPTIEKMQVLTDAASIMGEEVFPSVVRQLGQMSAKGKVMAQDLNVMAEAGINARKYLKEAFGKTVEEIQKSDIDIQRVIKAIFDGMERDFGGSAKKMMGSWQGLTAITKSYWVEINRSVMDAGVFDELKNQISDVNDLMHDWLDANKELINNEVPEYIDRIKTSINNVVDVYNAIPDYIVGAAGSGIVGRVIFGSWGPAKVVAMVSVIDDLLDKVTVTLPSGEKSGMGLKSLYTDAKELVKILKETKEMFDGTRDIHTGQLKGVIEFPQQAWENFRIDAALEKYFSFLEDVKEITDKTTDSTNELSNSIKKINNQLDKISSKAAIKSIFSPFDTGELETSGTRYMVGTSAEEIAEMEEMWSHFNDDVVELWKNSNDECIDVWEHTRDVMQDSIATFTNDVVRKEFTGVADFLDGVFGSISSAWSSMLGQMVLSGQGFKGMTFGGSLATMGLVGAGIYAGTSILDSLFGSGNDDYEEQLREERKRQAEELTAELQDIIDSINLSEVDYELKKLNEKYEEQAKQAKDLGVSIELLTEARAAELEQIIELATSGYNDLIGSMEDFLTSIEREDWGASEYTSEYNSITAELSSLNANASDYDDKALELYEKQFDILKELYEINEDQLDAAENMVESYEDSIKSIDDIISEFTIGDYAPAQSVEGVQNYYNDLLSSALTGDTDSLGDFTGYLSEYVDFMKAVGVDYSDLTESIVADLGAVKDVFEGEKTATELLIDALNANSEQLVDNTGAIGTNDTGLTGELSSLASILSAVNNLTETVESDLDQTALDTWKAGEITMPSELANWDFDKTYPQGLDGTFQMLGDVTTLLGLLKEYDASMTAWLSAIPEENQYISYDIAGQYVNWLNKLNLTSAEEFMANPVDVESWLNAMPTGSLYKAAYGGVFSGPETGYEITMHGTEAVVSPKRGLPVSMDGFDNAEGNSLLKEQNSLLRQLIKAVASSDRNVYLDSRAISQAVNKQKRINPEGLRYI